MMKEDISASMYVCMIQQAYEYVSSSLWHYLMFFFFVLKNQQIEIR